MRIEQFDFDLPAESIAQRPAVPRDSARLLNVVSPLEDLLVRDLPRLLRPGDLLVVNDTRVLPARLRGRRGAVAVELMLHKQEGPACWRAFARPAKRLRPGDRVEIGPDFAAEVVERDGAEVVLRFDRAGGELIAAIGQYGEMPVPPYIRGGTADDRDRQDYQTLFAARDGAVAAPTAALHFTPELIAALDAAGIRRTALTLHVGAGTFLPVKVDDVREHRMHAEWGEVGRDAATAVNETRAAGGRVVAVGTTSLRLLEAAARDDGTVAPFAGDTDLFILPGYRFKAIDMLLTNFHLPRSTLFMLVCAFAGTERMRAAYAHAIGAGYRFYSYGDGCLLRRAEPGEAA